MNILEALTQLRDDLKTWVTINLNALNSKLEENTVSVDQTLNSSSTNPIQNKPVATAIINLNNLVGAKPVHQQISEAVENQDHFSGDYNDLTNAPSITESDQDNLVVIDPQGHVILKVDNEGLHATDITSNSELVATQAYVDHLIAKSDTGVNSEYVNESIKAMKQNLESEIQGNGDYFAVLDKNGHVILRVDDNGIHSTSLSIKGRNIIDSLDSIKPVKGMDYFTTQDKNEIINDVVNALPLWTGGTY